MPETTTPTRTIPIVEYLVIDDGEPYLSPFVCRSCGAMYFDRRNGCARCEGRDFDRGRVARTGTVRSFTVIQRGAPGTTVPYVSAVIDLEGGCSVKANLIDVPDPTTIARGTRAELVTFEAGSDDDGTVAIAFGFVLLQPNLSEGN